MHENGPVVQVHGLSPDDLLDERTMGPILARAAAILLREDPSPDYVGVVADAGTKEARRCRTAVEQVLGIELELTAHAGVLPIDDLKPILGDRLQEPVIRWLVDPSRGNELRYVICTRDRIRLAAAPLP